VGFIRPFEVYRVGLTMNLDWQLIAQVLSMTQAQIDVLPEESRNTIMQIVRPLSTIPPPDLLKYSKLTFSVCLLLDDPSFATIQRAQAAASMGGRR
jgi:hypothetical protein